MDHSIWRKVLLEWVNATGFLSKLSYNLNQTEIETFYVKLKENKNDSMLDMPDDLKTFLNSNYPDFPIEFDVNELINGDDYIYVYSLLLHYTCVRHPYTDIQDACKTMKNLSQSMMVSFLQATIDRNTFDRDALNLAIEETASANPLQFPDLFSPTKTDGPGKESPPTPKTKLLDNWNAENKRLRAVLETERDEKGFLETQLKQMDDKFRKLLADHRVILDENHKMKNELFVRDAEHKSSNDNFMEEQINRRLHKEISIKEEEIIQLKNDIAALNDQTQMLNDKLRYTQQQVRLSREQIISLTEIVDQVHIELSDRSIRINELEMTKKELERYINETRSPNGLSMDSSSDCLEISLTNASTCTQPENLGCSVVDVQFREQLTINTELRERLHTLEDDHRKLVTDYEAIMRKSIEESDNFKIELENIMEKSTKLLVEKEEVSHRLVELETNKFNSDLKLNETIERLTAMVDLKSKSYDELKSFLNKLNDELSVSKQQLESKDLIIKQLSNDSLNSNEKIDRLNNEIKKLTEQSIDLQEKIGKSIITVENQEKIIKELEEKYESKLNPPPNGTESRPKNEMNRLDDLKCQMERSKRQLHEQIDILEQTTKELIKKISVLSTSNDNEAMATIKNDIKRIVDTKQAILLENANLNHLMWSLNTSITEIRHEQYEIEKEMCTIQSNHQLKINQIVQLNYNLKECNGIITQEKSLNAEWSEKYNELREKFNDHMTNCIDRSKEIDKLKKKIHQLTEREELNDRIVKEKSERTTQLQGTVNEMIATLTGKTQTIKKLKSNEKKSSEMLAKSFDLSEKGLDIIEQITEAISCFTNLKSDKLKLELEKSNIQTLNHQLQQRNDDLINGNHKLSVENKSLNDINTVLTERIDELEPMINLDEKKLTEYSDKLIKTENELKVVMEQMEIETNRLNEIVNGQRVNLTKQGVDIEKYVEQIKCSEKEIESLKSDLNEMKKDLDEAIKKHNDLLTLYLNLDEEKQIHLSDIEKYSNEILELKRTVSNLQSKIDHLEIEMGKSIEQNIEVIEQNIQYKEELAEIKLELNRKRNDYEELSHKLTETDQEKLKIEQKLIEFDEITLIKQKLIDQLNETIKNIESDLELNRTELIVKEIEMSNLKKEYNLLSGNYETLKSEMDAIKTDRQITEHKSLKYKESAEQFCSDISVLHAKLKQNRQLSEEKQAEWEKLAEDRISENRLEWEGKLEKKEAEWEKIAEDRIKENRLEMEGKLEKMKEKMKSLYTDEMAKVKLRHEKEIYQLRSEIENISLMNEKYESQVKKISHELYQMNEKHLDLLKDNEFIKGKIRMMESKPQLTYNQPNINRDGISSATSHQLIAGMEDEEGEIFDNTYLMDLKTGGGRISPTGRPSVRFSELKMRNSMLPQHLRSAYAIQYHDQQFTEDDVKLDYPPLNDSMFSVQSEVKRGTLYQKPGPPTPSKNAGRLSLGGGGANGDRTIGRLSFGYDRDILKESNYEHGKKPTPGKLRSIFASSKVKDELKSQSNLPVLEGMSSTPLRRKKKSIGTTCNRKSSLFGRISVIRSIDENPLRPKYRKTLPSESGTTSESNNDQSINRKRPKARFSIANRKRTSISVYKMCKSAARIRNKFKSKYERSQAFNCNRIALNSSSTKPPTETDETDDDEQVNRSIVYTDDIDERDGSQNENVFMEICQLKQSQSPYGINDKKQQSSDIQCTLINYTQSTNSLCQSKTMYLTGSHTRLPIIGSDDDVTDQILPRACISKSNSISVQYHLWNHYWLHIIVVIFIVNCYFILRNFFY